MKKLFLSIILVAGVYGFAIGQQGSQSQSSSQSQASANDPNWEKIGEKTVDLSSDKGIFNWNTDREKTVRADEKYSAIKFKAKDAPVNLTNVQVEYENGQKQDLSINAPVQVNSDSKVISLNSQSDVDKITFNYSKNESAGTDKAKIEVWGLKSNSSQGMGKRSGTDVDKDLNDVHHDVQKGAKDMDRDVQKGINDVDHDVQKSTKDADRSISNPSLENR